MAGAQGITQTSGRFATTRIGFTAYCAHCRCETLFSHVQVANRRHFVLSILTGGLWLVIWLAVLVGRVLRPWRCCECGWHKPEFRTTRQG